MAVFPPILYPSTWPLEPPPSAKQYISSFIGFAPANDPEVLGLVIIAKPTGVYYGGTIAAPVLQSVFENILPYLGIETVETSE